jgi:hypothetical protein
MPFQELPTAGPTVPLKPPRIPFLIVPIDWTFKNYKIVFFSLTADAYHSQKKG